MKTKTPEPSEIQARIDAHKAEAEREIENLNKALRHINNLRSPLHNTLAAVSQLKEHSAKLEQAIAWQETRVAEWDEQVAGAYSCKPGSHLDFQSLSNFYLHSGFIHMRVAGEIARDLRQALVGAHAQIAEKNDQALAYAQEHDLVHLLPDDLKARATSAEAAA